MRSWFGGIVPITRSSRHQQVNPHIGHDHFPIPTPLIAGIHELPDLPDHLPRRSDVAQVAIRLDVVKGRFNRGPLAGLESGTAQNKQRRQHDRLRGAGSVQHLQKFQGFIDRRDEVFGWSGGLDGAAQINPNALLTEGGKVPCRRVRLLRRVPFVQGHLDLEVGRVVLVSNGRLHALTSALSDLVPEFGCLDDEVMQSVFDPDEDPRWRWPRRVGQELG